jgi:hypothetical protein
MTSLPRRSAPPGTYRPLPRQSATRRASVAWYVHFCGITLHGSYLLCIYRRYRSIVCRCFICARTRRWHSRPASW